MTSSAHIILLYVGEEFKNKTASEKSCGQKEYQTFSKCWAIFQGHWRTETV
jgi:hypothetical protein